MSDSDIISSNNPIPILGRGWCPCHYNAVRCVEYEADILWCSRWCCREDWENIANPKFTDNTQLASWWTIVSNVWPNPRGGSINLFPPKMKLLELLFEAHPQPPLALAHPFLLLINYQRKTLPCLTENNVYIEYIISNTVTVEFKLRTQDTSRGLPKHSCSLLSYLKRQDLSHLTKSNTGKMYIHYYWI